MYDSSLKHMIGESGEMLCIRLKVTEIRMVKVAKCKLKTKY